MPRATLSSTSSWRRRASCPAARCRHRSVHPRRATPASSAELAPVAYQRFESPGDGVRQVVRRAGGIEHEPACRLLSGERQVALTNAVMESVLLALEVVFGRVLAFTSLLDRQVEQHREVGHETA